MKNLCERKDFFSRSEQVKVNIKVTYNILIKDAAVHKTKDKLTNCCNIWIKYKDYIF